MLLPYLKKNKNNLKWPLSKKKKTYQPLLDNSMFNPHNDTSNVLFSKLLSNANSDLTLLLNVQILLKIKIQFEAEIAFQILFTW